MAATPGTVTGVQVGTSGWSYPSWRGGFYPEGADPKTFLSFYSERFDTVELNTTGYRLPSADQFRRWAEQVPDGFTFAPKLPLARPDRLGPFLERVLALGDRLGPLRIVVQSPRDEGLLAYVLGSLPPEVQAAWDVPWDHVPGQVRVNDEAAEPFRYLRLREPPYSDAEIEALAARIRPPAVVYFRHEDAATAPQYAERLASLVRGKSTG